MNKSEAVLLGAHGITIREKDLRPESLSYLRSGGFAVEALPVTLSVYPRQPPVITDGRHRIFVAREQGRSWVRGIMIGYGPRGGVRWTYSGKIAT